MNDPLEQLSDEDLKHLSEGNLEGMSDDGLKVVAAQNLPQQNQSVGNGNPGQAADNFNARDIRAKNSKTTPELDRLVGNALSNTPFAARLGSIASGKPVEDVKKGLRGFSEKQQGDTMGEKISGAVGSGLGSMAGYMPAALATGGLAGTAGAGAGLANAVGLIGGGAIQGGASASANDQNVLEGAVKGGAFGAVGAGASKIGAQLIPSFIPGAERIGSSLGFGAVGAGATALSGGSKEDVFANAVAGAGMGAVSPMGRKADINEMSRLNMMENTVDMTLKNIGVKPKITKNMSTKSYVQAQTNLKTAMVDLWKTYRGSFSGKDNTPANAMELVGASDMAMKKAKQDMVDAQNKSIVETQVTPQKQVPVMEQRNIWNKDKGAYETQTLPKIGKDGQPIMQDVAQPPQTKMVQTFFLDGNKIGRQLAGVLTSNKKVLEVAGEYDLKSIRKRIDALRNKTISIDEVPKILAELNQTYGKDSKIANINKELADIIRQETEAELNRVDSTLQGTAGKDFRDARRRWGANIELHDRLLRLANKQSDMPQESMADKGSKAVGAVQTGLGIASHNPLQATLGGMELLLNKYGKGAKTKDPVEAIGNMFRTLDKQDNLRTLNQQITEMASRKPMNNLRKVAPAVIGGIAMGAAGMAQAAPPTDEQAKNAILGEVGPGGIDAMRNVASAIRNRDNGLKGIYGQNNKNVVDKKYTPKQEKEAQQAWQDSKKTQYTKAKNWYSDADLKKPKVQNNIKSDKVKFEKNVGGNNFYVKENSSKNPDKASQQHEQHHLAQTQRKQVQEMENPHSQHIMAQKKKLQVQGIGAKSKPKSINEDLND